MMLSPNEPETSATTIDSIVELRQRAVPMRVDGDGLALTAVLKEISQVLEAVTSSSQHCAMVALVWKFLTCSHGELMGHMCFCAIKPLEERSKGA